MKEIQVLAYCDNAEFHADERAESVTERTVSLDGKRPVLLDLCEVCDKQIESLIELMKCGTPTPTKVHKAVKSGGAAAPAVSVPRGPRKFGPVTADVAELEANRTCPECKAVSVTRGALGQHLYAKHYKAKLSSYEWTYA